MKNGYFSLRPAVLVFILATSVAACDFFASDGPAQGDEHPITAEYSYGVDDAGNEFVVTSALDKNLVQTHQTFRTMEHYHSKLEAVEEDRELKVNAALYERLINANTPAEISLLDNDGTVTIGVYKYFVTEVAAYRLNLNASSESREVVEYWGEDGLELSRELTQLYGAMRTPAELAELEFRNPFVAQKAEDFLQGRLAKSSTRDDDELGPVEVCLPDDEIVSGVERECYPIMYIIWNESTGRSRFRRRAHAGTYVEVDVGEGFVPLTHMSVPFNVYRDIGRRVRLHVIVSGGKGSSTASCRPLMDRGPLDYTKNPPYEYLSTRTSCYHVAAVAKRKKNRGATSEHGGGTTDYFNKTWISSYSKWYLIYSARAYWHYSYVELG